MGQSEALQRPIMTFSHFPSPSLPPSHHPHRSLPKPQGQHIKFDEDEEDEEEDAAGRADAAQASIDRALGLPTAAAAAGDEDDAYEIPGLGIEVRAVSTTSDARRAVPQPVQGFMREHFFGDRLRRTGELVAHE